MTVFLDAGHGGPDPGAVGSTEGGATVDEASSTLGVETDVTRVLRAEGYRVVDSRTNDSTVLRLGPRDVSGNLLSVQGVHDDIVARDECANLSHAAALVGIYFDAGFSDEDAGGLTAYDPERAFSAASLRLATLLQSDVMAAMDDRGWDIPDDGVQADGQLGSLVGDPAGGGLAARAAAYGHLLLLGPASSGYQPAPSEMPGAIIEPLYLTDPFEAGIADSAEGREVIASGIAEAVGRFLQRTP